jgi:endonuclease/exonuclease/phosphatase family metal-dependent hydrolase
VRSTRRAMIVAVAAVGLGLVGALPVTPAASATPTAPAAYIEPAGQTGPAGPPLVEARLATYNIHAGAGGDNRYDLERTAAAIRALDADVVGIQEADVHWGARSQWQDTVAELGRRLGMQVGFAPIYSFDPLMPGHPRREYGVAVLSRWDIVAVENHDITRLSTQVPDPVPEPAPGFLEATIQVRGARTHVYVTHLDYRGDPTVREMQVADTREILAADPAGANQALLGDLNAQAGAPELAPLWEVLQDAWAEAPVRTGGPGLTYPAVNPTERIDFVTTSPNTTIRSAHTQSDPAHTGASDHRAVVACVLLNQGSENTR